MTTIHFVRHGQTDWNAEIRIQGTSESTLSELGVQQARTLRDRLRGKQFDRVFSSDLQRTRQTTDILLDGDTGAVEFRSALREIHLGPWEGVLLDEARQTHPEDVRHFREEPDNFALPGAETFHQLQDRASHDAFVAQLSLAAVERHQIQALNKRFIERSLFTGSAL